MKCPVDSETLVISERNNIEIDYCPSCRGVWLDRGELDKLIERSTQQNSASHNNNSRDDHREQPRQSYDHRDDKYRRKKKESFLGEIFDF